MASKSTNSRVPWKPTRAQLESAEGKTLPDLIAPGLRVLFCGINPGLYTAAIGHHFGRPGNRFWPTLFAAGLTPRLVSPFEESDLLGWGLGITNFVARATATAAELRPEEYVAGRARLEAKVQRHRPKILAVLGVGAYRMGFARPNAKMGRQEEMIDQTEVWALPNPSGLNANYQLPELAKMFRELNEAARRKQG